MKKFAILFALIFVCACGGGGSGGSGGDNGGDNGGGDGAIITEDMLLDIDCAKDYSLGGNISIISAWQGLCPNGYTGTFDGDGYTITFTGTVNKGLFAQIGNNGEVKNLKIKASNGITGGAVTIGFEHNVAGAVAGFANANSTIDNCTVHITGGITAGDAAGGLAGYSGIISNSAAVVGGDIEAKNAGGLSGYASGTISNSFAVITDNITAPPTGVTAGGLAGNARAAISNSAALINGDINGNVSGNIWGDSNVSTHSNNYIFGGIAPYINSDSQGGKSVSAVDLKTSAWWGTGTDKLGLDSNIWDFTNTASNMPLQEALSGKADPIAWPAWLIDGNPTKIASADGLKYINNACDQDFVLVKDITVTEAWTGLCASATGYTGTLDGSGFGITFNGNVTNGLFAVIGKGTVKNLKISLSELTPATISVISSKCAGALAGAVIGGANNDPVGATIENIDVLISNDITYTVASIYVGGLAGYVTSAEIKDSTVTIKGTLSGSSGTSDVTYFGGLAARLISSTVDNCFVLVTGNLESSSVASSNSSYVGGIVAILATESAIRNSFAVIGGDISARAGVGGLAAANNTSSTIENSFAVVGGNIKISSTRSGASAGGLSGGNGNNTAKITDSFAVVGGNIDGSTNVDGTSAGITGEHNGESITNSVAIVKDDLTGYRTGNLWALGAGSGTNNYSYKDNVGYGTGTHDNKDGASVTAANLKGATWWINTTPGSGAGFTATEWSITSGSLPIPIALKDKAEAIDWAMFGNTWNGWNTEKNPLKWPDWMLPQP